MRTDVVNSNATLSPSKGEPPAVTDPRAIAAAVLFREILKQQNIRIIRS
jgi:hypothetical protein